MSSLLLLTKASSEAEPVRFALVEAGMPVAEDRAPIQLLRASDDRLHIPRGDQLLTQYRIYRKAMPPANGVRSRSAYVAASDHRRSRRFTPKHTKGAALARYKDFCPPGFGSPPAKTPRVPTKSFALFLSACYPGLRLSARFVNTFYLCAKSQVQHQSQNLHTLPMH